MFFKRVSIIVLLSSSLYVQADRGIAGLLGQLISSVLLGSAPSDSTIYSVRSALSLHPYEKNYIQQRQAFIKKQLSGTYHTLNKAPTIALCISGGGLRAMVSGLGFMQALQEQGLLDVTTYICGLSGSTWAISGWLESRRNVADYLTFLKRGLAIGLLDKVDAQDIIKELVKKSSSGQSISIIDIWGSVIAQKILYNSARKDLTQVTLGNYYMPPSDGSLPLPVYNCVTPLEGSDNQCYRWIEWTPFEVRCPFLRTAVPLGSMGSVFNNGKNTSSVPTQSLSFGLGTWGAAMSADVQDALADLDYSACGYEKEIIDMLLKEIQSHAPVDDATQMRPLCGYVPNWNYNTPAAVCSETHDLTLVDCGFLCNLPLVPMLDHLRGVDIIIILDASLGTTSKAELACLQKYAQANNLPFPVINTALLGNTCSVHKPALGSAAPTFIYFPLVANAAYKNGWDPAKAAFTSTLNLRYTPAQMDLLSGLTYAACCQNISTIWSVIDQYAR